MKQITTQIKGIAKKAVQATENKIKEASVTKYFEISRISTIEIHKTLQTCEKLMTSTTNRNNRSHPGPMVTATTSTTNCSIVSASFTQRLNKEAETPEHKTLNNALVTTNEALSIKWKLSVSHTPPYTQDENNAR